MTFRPPRPGRVRRAAAGVAAAAMVLAACGGDDEPVAVPETVDPGAPVLDGPVSTLSPEIPDSFEGGVGPVDVTGDPLPPLEDESNDPAIGMQAPSLVGLDLDGRPIHIDPAEDGPTMIVFVAHWCPHCNNEVPKLNEMHYAGDFPRGLNVVAVSTAVSPDRPNWPPVEWLKDTMEWSYPAMLDGIDVEQQSFIAASAYGVTGFPMVVLVDGDGTVVSRWSGEREREQIVAEVDKLGLS